jgi:hypothetical protein
LSKIPNHFHFIYGLKKQREPFHLCHYLCLESCYQVNRPEKISFYYRHMPHGEYWDRIKDRLSLEKVELSPIVSNFRYGFRNRWSKRYSYAHHADFIRLEKLIEWGGIYADIDTIFVNPIPDLLYSKPFVLGREGDIECQTTGEVLPSLCNAFIMAEKGAEFGRLWLERMEQAFDGSWSSHSTLLPQRLSEAYPDLIHIEPARSFYKHMWTREGFRTLFEGCDLEFSGVYSIHLWSHLWWSKRRKDFSNFHAGLITEENIRTIPTTFNLLARRYLQDTHS